MSAGSEPRHLHVAALALALAVVVGGWLLFEYGNHSLDIPTPAQSGESREPVVQETLAPLNEPQVIQTAPSSRAQAESTRTTFRCVQGNRTLFGDKPCAAGAKTVSVETYHPSPASNRSDNLGQLQQKAAAMEAARLVREKRYDAKIAAEASTVDSTTEKNRWQCRQIDQQIAGIDSQLRRPHTAQIGDFWNGQRRKLTEERFSLDC